MKTSAVLVAALLLSLPAAAEEDGAAHPALSPKHSPSAYRAENEEVILLVDGFAAYYSAGDAFLPLQICVAVKKSRTGLGVTPDRFVLIDPEETAYTASTPVEVAVQHRHLRRDLRLMEQQRLAPGHGFDAYEHLRGEFYWDNPGPDGGTSRVSIPASMWWKGAIYFPMPPSGLDGLFTLKLRAEGAAEEIAVRFEIRHKKKNAKKAKR